MFYMHILNLFQQLNTNCCRLLYQGYIGIKISTVITARCTLVQSAVLRSHVVCLSVRLSVCNVGEL